MTLRGLAIALALPLLASCANQGVRNNGTLPFAPLYREPTSGPQARLLLRVTQPGGMYVLSTYENAASCSGRREFVRATVQEPERISRQIPAGRVQTVGFLFLRQDNRVCELMMSFEPARGRTYLMRNSVEGERCHVELIDVTSLDNPAAVPHLRRERVGYGRLDNACKPVASTSMPAAPAPTPRPTAPTLDDFRDLLPK